MEECRAIQATYNRFRGFPHMSPAIVDGQQRLQPPAGRNGSPPMAATVQAQQQHRQQQQQQQQLQHPCKDESPGVSPPRPQTVSMSPTACTDMPPESTSPVMLATMQPVSVDEFGDASAAVDYHNHHNHHHHHHQQQHQQQQQQQEDPLDQKTVIYIPGTDPQQTIIYDPQNPEGSLPAGITIQQQDSADGGSAVSVLVQGQPAHHHQYLGSSGTTVLVMQELVDDMGHILHRLVRNAAVRGDTCLPADFSACISYMFRR